MEPGMDDKQDSRMAILPPSEGGLEARPTSVNPF